MRQAKDLEDFQKMLAAAQRAGRLDRLLNAHPIGFLPNGELDTDLNFKGRIVKEKPDPEMADIDAPDEDL